MDFMIGLCPKRYLYQADILVMGWSPYRWVPAGEHFQRVHAKAGVVLTTGIWGLTQDDSSEDNLKSM